MKAITIQQPFATLIMTGLKPFEYRTWATGYRGSLAIHAGRRCDGFSELLKKHYDYFAYHKFDAITDFPTGVILGSVELKDTIPPTWWNHRIDPVSRDFVSMTRHYAWELGEPEWLPIPTVWKGSLSLWEAPTELFLPTLTLEEEDRNELADAHINT